MSEEASHPPTMIPAKAGPEDFTGRFREIISDPLNLLIRRHPLAGTVDARKVYLHTGVRVPADGEMAYYGDFSQILVLNRGVHEPLEEFTFQAVVDRLPPAPTMMELGSYWGHYSMWLKSVRPAARVILVDSDEHNLAVGQENFRENGFEGEFHLAAVGSNLPVGAIYDFGGNAHLDILHADIQGCEVDMLRGIRQPLEERQIDYLFISTHSQTLHQMVIDHLVQASYRVEVSSDFAHETTSFDGLVFASSPEVPAVVPGFMPMGREEICSRSAHAVLDYLGNTLNLR